MAKYFSDGTAIGAVYEEDGRFIYNCEHCSWSCSGPDEYRLEMKAYAHDKGNHPEVYQIRKVEP